MRPQRPSGSQKGYERMKNDALQVLPAMEITLPTHELPPLPVVPRTVWRPTQRTAKIAAVAMAALTAGLIFNVTPPNNTPLPVESPAPIIDTADLEPVAVMVDAPAQDLGPDLLAGVIPMDLDTQRAIYELCGYNGRLFCTVMAIAQRETRYDARAVGDGGDSIGIMQINTRWQYDRIERLGVTDLLDPVQNVSVALDYIGWLANEINPEDPESLYGTDDLFVAYNSGYWGAQGLWKAGTHETDYSRECRTIYQALLGQLGEAVG